MKTLTDTAIAILFVIAAITLFAEPAETSSSWLTDFILIKAAAAASILAIHLICRKREGRRAQ